MPSRRPDPGQPSRRLRRLWAVTRPDVGCHGEGAGAVGEYAALLRRYGRARAAEVFPGVAAHVATGCPVCAEDLQAVLAFLEADEAADPPQPPT
jgi:hypothetical protein